MFGSAPQGHFLRALHSQGGKQADRLYIGMLGGLITFLGSAAEYLRGISYGQERANGG